jgi:hypothetical protein
MQIVDHTPYRNETGEIDLRGRIQSILKFGPAWYDGIKAQDVVISVLEKQMNNTFVLLRNVTLPEAEITLPLILLGPAGIFLIHVTPERGVYHAKGDEWGTIVAERFAPARNNQVMYTKRMARVLQVYLDRQGYKGMLVVEPILMAADPGMHIESVRPSVRVVMSDALERFSISVAQIRGTIAPDAVPTIARVIVKGHPKEKPVEAPPAPVAAAAPVTQSNGVFQNEPQETDGGVLSSDFGFSFQDEEPDEQKEPAAQTAIPVTRTRTTEKPAAKPMSKGFLGLKKNQLIILGGILLVWLCLIAAFIIYFIMTFNA